MANTVEWFNEIDRNADNKISNTELRAGVYLLGVFLTPLETQKLRVLMSQGRVGSMDADMFTAYFPDADRAEAEAYLLLVIDRHVKRVPNLNVDFAFVILFAFGGVVMLVLYAGFAVQYVAIAIISSSLGFGVFQIFKYVSVQSEIRHLKATREFPPALRYSSD